MKFSTLLVFALTYTTTLAAPVQNNFRSKNADDAERLTKEFATLNENSSCKDNEQACVEDQFAQCVNGKFVSTSCSGGLKCVVLPLVNKPGTSITCSTEEDRQARLADARGNSDVGKGKDAKEPVDPNNQPKGKEGQDLKDPNAQSPKDPKDSKDPKAKDPKAKDPNDTGNITEIRKQNADDAERLTKEFATLNENSSCKDNEQACVEDQFAQCVNGKFVSTSCSGGLKCVVLPLVNKAGTSITCSTEEDRQARLADARGNSDVGKGKDAKEPVDPNNQPKGKEGQDLKDPNAQPKGKEGQDLKDPNAQSPKDPKDSKDPKAKDPKAKDPKAKDPNDTGNITEIRKQNADDAERLTKEFATLNANSSCKDNEQACVEDQFAQCVNGKFVSTSCSGGLKCVVLPLVNKAGTSITCSTEEDRQARLDDARKNK